MTETTSLRRMPVYLVLAVIAGLLAGILWVQRPVKPIEITGTVLSPARPLAPFSLTDHKSQNFDNRTLHGKWSFLFFGYTNCPDVCPTTLFLFKMLASKLQAQPDLYKNTQFVFVSVDPERDTTEVLSRYINYYNPDFSGLTGSVEQIKQLTTSLGVPFFIGEHEPGQKNYTVDHSGAVILINPQGEFKAVFSAPQQLDKVHADYLNIIEHHQ